jgi:hypothetical protein
MAKAKEFKTIKQRAKEFVDKVELEIVDQYNWKMKEDLSDEDTLKALKVLAHFITIPERILNETETNMFNEDLFYKLNISKKD